MGLPRGVLVVLVAALAALAGCAGQPSARHSRPAAAASESPAAAKQDVTGSSGRAAHVPPPFQHLLPGMPPIQHGRVYAAAEAGKVQSSIAHEPQLIYVPNSYGRPITTVISQRTRKVVRILHTGRLSQHVTPSYDLKTLYVEASAADRLVALDPKTGRIEKRIPQSRPYNLYFTPDGKRAIVMAEQDDEIVFDDPHTFQRVAVVKDRSCRGPNHADFSANGRYFIVTCEFSGSLLKINTLQHRVTARLTLPPGAKPQDIRLSPTGRSFYVADMGRDKLLRISWKHLRVIGSIDTPAMPHGIYPSRDGRFLYVSDRGAGKVSVVSVARNRIVDTWRVPGGGSPDMGGLSADGKILWLSGRYDGDVYGWDTRTGKLIAKIHVGGSPHGLLVWPQPGRYSLGHTGNMR
ncbi:MAG TPA: YncE family protein [Marmoricola sp.]|nr:YncE family protein [Marmoricola sp.]